MRLESPLDYSHNPVKILKYPAPKYKSLIISRTSEILTLGEKSSASLGYLGSEAIFVKTVEKSKKISNPKKIEKPWSQNKMNGDPQVRVFIFIT